jgi:hypothetical protein
MFVSVALFYIGEFYRRIFNVVFDIYLFCIIYIVAALATLDPGLGARVSSVVTEACSRPEGTC